MTLRQLHYRLVSLLVGIYLNDRSCYAQLSSLTAEARRNGSFPALLDQGRAVRRPWWNDDPGEAVRETADRYQLDRTLGQPVQTWLVFEKATLEPQFASWTEEFGIPIAALRGYSSESLERSMFEQMLNDGRDIVVHYVGDFDPEGVDIERNFVHQARRIGLEFRQWRRLAVSREQIAEFGLVPAPGKASSTRADRFIAKHGELVQVEVEAIDPAILERLVVDAVTDPRWFDVDTYNSVVARERYERQLLVDLSTNWQVGS